MKKGNQDMVAGRLGRLGQAKAADAPMKQAGNYGTGRLGLRNQESPPLAQTLDLSNLNAAELPAGPLEFAKPAASKRSAVSPSAHLAAPELILIDAPTKAAPASTTSRSRQLPDVPLTTDWSNVKAWSEPASQLHSENTLWLKSRRQLMLAGGGAVLILCLLLWVAAKDSGSAMPAKAVASPPTSRVISIQPKEPHPTKASEPDEDYALQEDDAAQAWPESFVQESHAAAAGVQAFSAPPAAAASSVAPPAAAAAPQVVEKPSPKISPAPNDLTLTGFVQMNGQTVANINGRFIAVGDEVNGATLLKICEHWVEMRRDAHTFRLMIGRQTGSPPAPVEANEAVPAQEPSADQPPASPAE